MYSENLYKVRKLIAQLFPKGRAFRITKDSVKEKVVNAMSFGDDRFIQDVDSVLDHILPDNDNFTEDDAALWELRLGINSNPDTTLEDRKAAIIQKLNHPGNIIPRQGAGYIEDQLQLAGFNVYVHENIPAQTPEAVLEIPLELGEMGEYEMGEIEMGSALSYYPDLFIVSEMGEIEMGGAEMGGAIYSNMVVNYIEQEGDSMFLVGDNYKCCFFIGGEILGTFADVPESRKAEFRQLVLQLKPAQSVAILFINYV